MPDADTPRPTGDVEPGWLVNIDGTWRPVLAIVKTERPDGTGRRWLYVEGLDAPEVRESTDPIEAKPPPTEEGTTP